MKKNLLLIFGLLGLVSLMAESSPKKSHWLSLLGMDNDAACCKASVCCKDGDNSCCDISNCCTNPGDCCIPASICCSSADDNISTPTNNNQAKQCVVQCKS